MRTIWMYDIPATSEAGGPMSALHIPAGGRVLHVAPASHRDVVSLFVEVDTDADRVERTFLVVRTGVALPHSGAWQWVGTAPVRAGAARHVLERIPTGRPAQPLQVGTVTFDYHGDTNPAGDGRSMANGDTWTTPDGFRRTWTDQGWV